MAAYPATRAAVPRAVRATTLERTAEVDALMSWSAPVALDDYVRLQAERQRLVLVPRRAG